MRQIPAIAIIREAYAYTFANLGAIIGLIWLPMVLVTVGEFFVSQHAGSQVQEAIAAGNPNAAGPVVLMLFLFYLAALALYAMMLTAVVQLVLGQRKAGALINFSFGALEWRVFRTLFGVVLFMLPGYLLFLLSTGNAGVAGAATAQGGAALLTAIALMGALIYFMVRLTAVILPVLVNDDKPVFAKSWTLTSGNFWRLLGVFLGVMAPVYLALMLLMAAALGSELTPGATPTAEEVVAIRNANLPLIAGLGFLVAPLVLGLLVSASVFSWRALTQSGTKTDISV